MSIELEITYEGFGEGPLVGGGLEPPPPLNPALVSSIVVINVKKKIKNVKKTRILQKNKKRL